MVATCSKFVVFVVNAKTFFWCFLTNRNIFCRQWHGCQACVYVGETCVLDESQPQMWQIPHKPWCLRLVATSTFSLMAVGVYDNSLWQASGVWRPTPKLLPVRCGGVLGSTDPRPLQRSTRIPLADMSRVSLIQNVQTKNIGRTIFVRAEVYLGCSHYQVLKEKASDFVLRAFDLLLEPCLRHLRQNQVLWASHGFTTCWALGFPCCFWWAREQRFGGQICVHCQLGGCIVSPSQRLRQNKVSHFFSGPFWRLFCFKHPIWEVMLHCLPVCQWNHFPIEKWKTKYKGFLAPKLAEKGHQTRRRRPWGP